MKPKEEKERELMGLLSTKHRSEYDKDRINSSLEEISKNMQYLTGQKLELERQLQKHDGLDGKIDVLVQELASLKD